MSEPFGIEPLRRTAELSGDDPSAVVEVDVTNGLDRHVHAAVEVRGEPPMESSWVTVEPESFSLEANESRRLKVRIAPPSGTAAGEYPFSLRVYDVDQPADAFARSPSITATVQAAEAEERRGTPGWLVPALAGLVVIVLGVTVWQLVADGDGNGEVDPPSIDDPPGEEDPPNDDPDPPDPDPPGLTPERLEGCALGLDRHPDGDHLLVDIVLADPGNDGWSGPIPWAIERDGTVGGSILTPIEVPPSGEATLSVPALVLGPEDYGRALTFAVIVDPDNGIHPDSRLAIEVEIPSRPASDMELGTDQCRAA